MTDDKKSPPDETPPPGHDSLKAFLAKLAEVPKAELDEKEADYQKGRDALQKTAR